MNSFILLIVSVVVGTHILSFFGISLPVVQVGGGLIVVSTGWAMLTRSDQVDRGQTQQTVTQQDILKNAFYPLTLPLTVGRGRYLLRSRWERTNRDTWEEHFGDCSCSDWRCADRGDDLRVLRIRGPAGGRGRA